MIDPSEPKTRLAVINDTAVAAYSLAGTIVLDEDATLRQVHMQAKDFSGVQPFGDAVLTTDPDFTGPQVNITSTDLWLSSQLSRSWTDLAFPVYKGQKLYWGVTAGTSLNAITAVFT